MRGKRDFFSRGSSRACARVHRSYLSRRRRSDRKTCTAQRITCRRRVLTTRWSESFSAPLITTRPFQNRRGKPSVHAADTVAVLAAAFRVKSRVFPGRDCDSPPKPTLPPTPSGVVTDRRCPRRPTRLVQNAGAPFAGCEGVRVRWVVRFGTVEMSVFHFGTRVEIRSGYSDKRV